MLILLPLALIALLLVADPPLPPVVEKNTAPLPPVTPATGRTMDQARAEYDTASARYKSLIDEAVRTGNTSALPEIRTLNTRLSALLEEMMTIRSPVAGSTTALHASRDELVARLRKIQLDYNGLVETTDELETLRRIRAQESDGFFAVLYWHLIALGIVALGVVLAMIYSLRQSTQPSAISPPATAVLT